MEQKLVRRRFWSMATEYKSKIWLFWLALFWFMYATVVAQGTLPSEFTALWWRLWAAGNGFIAVYFFLVDPLRKMRNIYSQLAVGSVVAFCSVRSLMYIVDGRYAIVPVWGIIATLSLHSYKLGRTISEITNVLDETRRFTYGEEAPKTLDSKIDHLQQSLDEHVKWEMQQKWGEGLKND